MKKIFLTSGLVICMACPAFAVEVTGTGNECVINTLGVDNGSASLEALWNAKSYDIKYYQGSHGTAATTDPATFTGGLTYDATWTTKTLAEAGITAATGYTFQGWGTSIDGAVVYQAGEAQSAWTTDAGLSLYAIYSANPHTISFTCGDLPENASSTFAQDGVAPATVNVTYDAAYTALPTTANTCALPGYAFAGWSCTNGIVAAGGTYSVDADTVCKATWTPNTINLTWDSQGGTEIAPTTCTYDGSITLPEEPTKTGYTFGGWTVTSTTPASEQNPGQE